MQMHKTIIQISQSLNTKAFIFFKHTIKTCTILIVRMRSIKIHLERQRLNNITFCSWYINQNEVIEGREIINPLSPNIHIQILQTDLYSFP